MPLPSFFDDETQMEIDKQFKEGIEKNDPDGFEIRIKDDLLPDGFILMKIKPMPKKEQLKKETNE